MRRRQPLSRYAWGLALGAQCALMVGSVAAIRFGWVLALLLLLPLPWMARGSAYAHAANSLLVLPVLGGLIVFLDQPSLRVLAVFAAVAFVASVLYVKWLAVERRAALAARTESSGAAAPAETPGPGRPES